MTRPHRSELAVPGIRPELFPKAAAGPADAVFLDLEDSVPEAQKAEARANVVKALREIDWGRKILAVRINGLDTPHAHRDVIALIEEGGERLDVIMVPKVGDPREVFAMDLLCTGVEAAAGRARRVGLGLVIETAKGLAQVEAIAAASPRVESLHLGVADLAASLGMRTTQIGGLNPDYAGPGGMLDPWHFAVARVIAAARAAGVRPIDGPYGDFRDAAGLEAAARRGRALGAEGKMAIHPGQVASINAAFTPDEREVAQARRVLAAMEEAQAAGRAAVALDGRLLDIASIRQAEAMVAKAERMAGA
ncbi:HpcH/HpaI aldolase/citrate lyase family protein [Falsiroseomonas sp. CW058]|uniref:HpcH/HpaI aldolase/citrate lyase family protein n=1 Tax=Falsiroseomonas sp. CW058 TaxID=3388664 RepID=UPI003D317B5B